MRLLPRLDDAPDCVYKATFAGYLRNYEGFAALLLLKRKFSVLLRVVHTSFACCVVDCVCGL